MVTSAIDRRDALHGGQQIKHPCRVVATGGLARLVAPETTSIEAVDDDLTLAGLRLLFERNQPTADKGAWLVRAPCEAS